MADVSLFETGQYRSSVEQLPAGNGINTRGSATTFAAEFQRRIPEIMAVYREKIRELHSPMALQGEGWELCEREARRILDDCLRGLQTGAVTPTSNYIADVLEPGSDRIYRCAVHVLSVRAGIVLSDLAISALWECSVAANAGTRLLVEAIQSLQQSIALRLEFGSVGYDANLLQRVREIFEQGKFALAREIHDDIGNSLCLALRQIELYEAEIEVGGHSASEHVRSAKTAVRETILKSRELMTELRRPAIAGSLEVALKGFSATIGEPSSSVRVQVRGVDDLLPESISEELFVMTRECLRNAYMHAAATQILVDIVISPNEVRAEIVDDGNGFQVQVARDSGRCHGLSSLYERTELVNGRIDIHSVPGQGTRVTISIPFPEQSAVE